MNGADVATGMYVTSADGMCACGHLAGDHERVGFRKPCLVIRCGCADLDLPEERP